MRPLSTAWTKHISDPKQKEDLENALRNSSALSNRLLDLLDEWEEELRRDQMKSSAYDNPNWALRQAHYIGDLSRIRKLKDLFNFLRN